MGRYQSVNIIGGNYVEDCEPFQADLMDSIQSVKNRFPTTPSPTLYLVVGAIVGAAAGMFSYIIDGPSAVLVVVFGAIGGWLGKAHGNTKENEHNVLRFEAIREELIQTLTAKGFEHHKQQDNHIEGLAAQIMSKYSEELPNTTKPKHRM